MNLVQLVRKSRLGADAIFPSGQASRLWQDDEMVDLVEQANNELNLKLRLAKKHWGMQSMSPTPTIGTGTGAGTDVITTPVTQEGETYDPTLNLTLVTGQTRLLLPPDFGEVVKIFCIDQTTARFIAADYDSEYWTDLEQSSRNTDGTYISINAAFGATIYFDVLGNRTLVLCPPIPAAMKIQLDYIPMKRPLRYSVGNVTVTQGSTAVVGSNTTWVTDNIYSEASSQAAELVTGSTDLNTLVRLDRDYPRVQSIADDAHLTLVSPWAGATGSVTAVLAMSPSLPREYHQWIAELTSTFMLRKVSPDISDKYAQAVLGRFDTTVRPTAGVRQTQTSKITDDESLMGGLSDR